MLAEPYASRSDFLKEHGTPYAYAYNHGWLDLICEHMKQTTKSLSDEDLISRAKGYEDRTALKSADFALSRAIAHRGLDAEAYGHMTRLVREKYTEDELLAIAREYQVRNEFIKAEYGAYSALRKHGLLDIACSHMEVAIAGFKKSEPAQLYYIRVESEGMVLYKIGITNYTWQKRHYVRDVKKCTEIWVKEYKIGGNAYNRERKILREHADSLYFGKPVLASGNSELFTNDVLGLDRQ